MKHLREGLTTGTTATAAAMAALCLAISGTVPVRMRTPLPPFGPGKGAHSCMGQTADCWRSLEINMAGFGVLSGERETCIPLAHAGVVKDGGDDPDATHGALICASLYALPADVSGFLRIEGGAGVGIVTMPGIGLPVGDAAINPVPRKQLEFGLKWLYERIGKLNPGIKPPFCVVISVPDGEWIARKTLNRRLGIVGGISILGTHGFVRPYSNEAWIASIQQSLNVAAACGSSSICLSTGRRSEKLLRSLYPALTPQSFVQAGDCVARALRMAANMNFETIVWGCFFGKLLKLARGMDNTHAAHGLPDLAWLANICAHAGLLNVDAVSGCLTALAALELILQDRNGKKAIQKIMDLAYARASAHAGRPIVLHLFHMDGRELAAR